MWTDSPAVDPHQLGFAEEVTAHGRAQLADRGPGRDVDGRVQRGQAKEVPVRFPRRWARAAVANPAEVVASLPGTVVENALVRDSPGEVGWRRRKVEQDPMN